MKRAYAWMYAWWRAGWVAFAGCAASLLLALGGWLVDGETPPWGLMLFDGWVLGVSMANGVWVYGDRVERWVLRRLRCRGGRLCSELFIDEMVVPSEMRSRFTFEAGYECARCGTRYVVTAMMTGDDTWVVTDRRQTDVLVPPQFHLDGVASDGFDG